MKNILILIMSLCLLSCNGQKEKNTRTEKKLITKKYNMKKFDTALFNKNQIDGEWNFNDNAGNKIIQTKEIEDGYTVETINKNETLNLCEYYFDNGNMLGRGLRFPTGFLKGVWITYNIKGEIAKQIDYDIPYKNYPWEKVEAYLISRKVDLKDNYTRVLREEKEEGTFWMISWDAQKLSKIGTKTITNIVIDVKAKKIVKEYETIYKDN